MGEKTYYRYLLDDEAHEKLRELAFKQHMSMSQVIRELVMRGHALMKGKYKLDEEED